MIEQETEQEFDRRWYFLKRKLDVIIRSLNSRNKKLFHQWIRYGDIDPSDPDSYMLELTLEDVSLRL